MSEENPAHSPGHGDARPSGRGAPGDEAPLVNRGEVRAVRCSVVDIRFDACLPTINSVLRAGRDGAIVVEVLELLDERHVRGIALTPTQGLARGAQVTDTGSPLKIPVGQGILGRMFDVFGNTLDRAGHIGKTSRQDRPADGDNPQHDRRHEGISLFCGIDEELFDVVSGFEALTERRKGR